MRPAGAATRCDRVDLHSCVELRLDPPSLGLGEFEAFALMDRAIDERDSMMTPIGSYPFFDPMRADPRFVELLRKMKLDL